MKQIIFGLLFTLSWLGSNAQSNLEIALQLDSMVKADQHWRNLLTKIRNSEVFSMDISTAQKKVMETDSWNYLLLKDLVDEYGFLNPELVGNKGTHNFWLLVQHQDANPDFQKEVLQLMKAELENNADLKMDYAYLLDRVNVNSGEKQVYGTQLTLNADSSSYIPKPLIEPEKLNERRKKMLLPPIEKYIAAMNERHYGLLKE